MPTIGVLKPGVVEVTDNEGIFEGKIYNIFSGKNVKLFVSSGTFSMNIDGSCQVLAEEVIDIDDIDESVNFFKYLTSFFLSRFKFLKTMLIIALFRQLVKNWRPHNVLLALDPMWKKPKRQFAPKLRKHC